MAVLIYFLVSIVAGFFPAFIARKKNRNFVLWWIYGALALPVALIHTLFLLINFEKGILIIRILLVVYALVIFYFITWFVSTQPVAMKYARLAESRYAIGSIMLERLDEITSGSVSDIFDYLKDKTHIPDEDVDVEMEYFEPRKITDRDYVEGEAIKVLEKIKGSYEMTIKSGAFNEWSVPQGEAKDVFEIYIKSLRILKEYIATSPESLESIYHTILFVESEYFGNMEIAEEYLTHLDREKEKAASDERRYELLEQYEYLGNRYILVGDDKRAKGCYDKTIDLYRQIASHEDKTGVERANIYFEIAKLYDKKMEYEPAIDALKNFLDIFFKADMYSDDDQWYELESFLKLPVINRRKNLENALDVFMAVSEQYKTPQREMVFDLENRIMFVFFSEISYSARERFVPILKKNYDHLIAEKDIYVLPRIKDAYGFFDMYNFDEVANTYLNAAKEVENNLKKVERDIIDRVTENVVKKINNATFIIEKIVTGETPLTDKVMEEMITLRREVLEASKQVNDVIIAIKDGKRIIDGLMRREEVVERGEIENAQTKISRATKNFSDMIKVVLREKEIVEKEYGEFMEDIAAATEEGEWISSNIAKASSNRKNRFRDMRAEAKNQVTSLQKEIEEIIGLKKEIGSQYNREFSTEELETINDEMKRQYEKLNELYKKVFPREAQEEAAAAEGES
ncbi:MAG: hypothetical protein JW881_07425 [Spirochaetales bacterium]|nr:hypothetical protein [Spirochaetales bacterium]